MKLQTTKKEIRNGFKTIVSIGYCDAQYLLKYKEPFAYSAGIYGWSCDYYQIGNKCISTGYQPIGINVNYTKLESLENKAQKIVFNNELKYDDKVSQIDALLDELLSL
jgi:hypothetical protein